MAENLGKVRQVCKNFLLKGDEEFAKKLQDDEFHDHYSKNRQNNQGIRTNVRTARIIENREYQELLSRHQMLETLEKQDALVAMQMQDELQDSLLSSELREHHSLTDEELAKQLQEKEILYEDYVSHKPIRNLSNQRPTTSTCNQRQVSTASTSGSLSDYDYRPYQSKKSNPNHGLETDENRDYNLAKYLQSEEEKKVRLQNQIKAESLQLARELQEQEDALYMNNRLYASPRSLQQQQPLDLNSKEPIKKAQVSPKASNQFAKLLPGYQEVAKNRQQSSSKQSMHRPAMARVLEKAASKIDLKKNASSKQQSLV